jgi:Cu/Ag efflux protein CusF
MIVRPLLAFLACLAIAPAAAQSLKDSAMAVDQTEAVVTVVSVDQQKRTVTIRGPKGGVATLNVPPESQNLDKVKAGDRFRMKYIEAVAVGIRKGGEPASDDKREVKVSPKGGTPGGMVMRTRTRSVVVDAVDYTNRYMAVRGKGGETVALKVADDVPLDQLSAGDRITVVHTEALAVELEPQPSKSAAKKSAKKM